MRGNELLDKMELIDPAYLRAAEAKPAKNVWGKWGALAACLCLAAAAAFAVVHPWEVNVAPVPGPTDARGPDEYPPASIVPGLTPDGSDSGNHFFPFVFNDVDAAPVGVSGMFVLPADNFCPMSAEESLDYFGVTLPEDGTVAGLELTGGGSFGGGHGVYRSEGGHVYFDVNSYEFTGSGKKVTLTLRKFFNMTPSPQQVANGPEPMEFTEIYGWELALFRYTDEDGAPCVYTEFVLDGVTYTLSVAGLGDNELALALMSFLPPKTDASDSSDPVTVTGTVTHVDSRKSDYFDGTEHHYSEDHDYITVDCDGTHLTVWLPGEANRFSIGDSVTVTYHGEPATAYNIWPGQLVSVE